MSTSANQESDPPLHVLLEISEAAADMQHYLHLDAAWTGAAEPGDELGAPDREALVSLGNKIDAQLATVERQAHALHRTFDYYHVWVNERIRTALASEHFTANQREGFRQALKVEDDDFAGRGVAIADTLAQRVPSEREELRRKLFALRENGPIPADWSKITPHVVCCAVAETAMLGGLVGCIFSPLGCVAALGGFLAYAGCGCEHF